MSEFVISKVRAQKQRGFILLVHTLMIAFTLAMVGLAVDAGTMYVIKGRLSSAVDAAALAAGRSLNLADSVSAATTAAQTTATQFFNANFPSGYLGTGTMNLTTPTFTQELDSNNLPNGILQIAVTASVPAPTYFMRSLNIVPGLSAVPNTITVGATGTASRRSTVMILVLDTSVSMNTPTTPTSCAAMVTAAQSFITNFSPYDTIGVVAFNVTAAVIYAPSSNFGTGGALNTILGDVTCGSSTNTASALWLAYEQIKSVGLPLAYNTIVLFTDGSPNGVAASFPLRTQSDTRYGPDYTQYSGTADSCNSTGSLCSPMAALCTGAATQTISGTIQQSSGQTDTGSTYGLFLPYGTATAPSYPATCTPAAAVSELAQTENSPVTTPPQYGGPQQVIRQFAAYIPDYDLYGNSTHGVPSTSTPPACPSGNTCTVAQVTIKSTGATPTYDTRDFWRFATNNVCAGTPTGTAATACADDSTAGTQYEGGVWTSFPADTNSNFFTAGAYKGYLRPDQPNSVVAASMNTAMAEAYWIRTDVSGCGGLDSNYLAVACGTLYHTTINTIYLTGNAGDQVDHEFLPIIANAQTIIALPYDSSFTNYTNPAYQSTQQQGLYQVTADKSTLTALFQNLASEVLRLSN